MSDFLEFLGLNFWVLHIGVIFCILGLIIFSAKIQNICILKVWIFALKMNVARFARMQQN